jgi:uncharacterized protein YjbI with pentapeptide repeats
MLSCCVTRRSIHIHCVTLSPVLQGANLSDVLMDRSVMNEANLKDAILERAVFTRQCKLTDCFTS